MSSNSPERQHAIACQILRAQHFAWREAARRLCPSVDSPALVNAMWEVTGEQTAQAYLKRIDRMAPLAPQVAECIAWSSQSMGEDAVVEAAPEPGAAFVMHRACPW